MFSIRGPKWPRKHSPGFTPGLPWVIAPPGFALKGQPGTSRIGSKPLNRIVGAFLAPTGRNVYLGLPRVNLGLSSLAPTGRARRVV
jgi:hypothetical protein